MGFLEEAKIRKTIFPVTRGFLVGSKSKIWKEPPSCPVGEGPPKAGHRLGQPSLSHRLESRRCHWTHRARFWLAFSVCSAHTFRPSP